jgi:hypothetical protein
MGGLKKANRQSTFLSVKADGKFHQQSEEGAPGAELYEWETERSSGSSWDIIYNEIEGRVSDIRFREVEWGLMLDISIAWEDGGATISLNAAHRYAEDLMKKLPAINFEEEVRLRPYNYKPKGSEKTYIGIAVYQLNGREWDKLEGVFFNPETKENLLGYPGDFPKKNPKTKKYDSNEIKIFNLKVIKFLTDYTTDNVIPKVKSSSGYAPSGAGPSSDSPQPVSSSSSSDNGAAPYADDDIPF